MFFLMKAVSVPNDNLINLEIVDIEVESVIVSYKLTAT